MDPDSEHEIHDHDRGLGFDLGAVMARRRMIHLVGLGGVAAVAAACGASGSTSGSATTAASSTSTTAVQRGPGGSPGGMPPGGGGGGGGGGSNVTVAEGEIPEETAGPYPGDGSNGINVLSESGIVRSDITESFGSGSAVAAGVPLTVELTVVDFSNSSAAMTGAAVYLWHCDREGRYSLYSSGVTNENYLRGVQETDSNGKVMFTTIFPAAYSGRWPHIHFEIYPSLAEATSASSKLRTSQLALPEDICDVVYATPGYEQSVRNLDQTSLSSDNVFSDGYSLQLANVTGSVSKGYKAVLNVPV